MTATNESPGAGVTVTGAAEVLSQTDEESKPQGTAEDKEAVIALASTGVPDRSGNLAAGEPGIESSQVPPQLAAAKGICAEISPRDMNPRPQVLLPTLGRPISEFAAEVGEILATTFQWFIRDERPVVLREVRVADPLDGRCRGSITTVFHFPTPTECRSLIERHLITGRRERRGESWLFVPLSMGRETAAALLASSQFKDRLPRIQRILDVPIPIERGGRLAMVQPGYDTQLQVYCRTEVAGIDPLPLAEAKRVLDGMLQGFPFANALSRCLAVARLLTPMCRALMGWSARPPLWIFEANRPRAGKDYLAGCCGVLYEGRANEDAPLDHDSAETKKRIIAALQSGRRFMHFANTTGDIHNDALEQAVTASH